MKFKGTIAAILSATLICTATVAAMAANVTPLDAENTSISTEKNQLSVEQQKMKVIQVKLDEKDNSYILAAPITDDGKTEKGRETRLNISEDTVYLDTQSGIAVNPADIKADDVIYAYHSTASTFSLPPQVACYAVVVNLSETSAPAHYLTAEKVTENKDGSITVLAEDGSLLVTLQKDSKISPYKTRNIATLADIKEGTRFFAWYDTVALSYPGQTTATRAVVLPNATETGAAGKIEEAVPPIGEIGFTPYRASQEATVTKVSTVKHEGDIELVPSVTVQTADKQTYIVNLGESTWMIDGQQDKVSRWTDVAAQTKVLKEGTKLTVWYGPAMTASEPAQISAEAIGINIGEKMSSPRLVTTENATHNVDGSVTILTNNGNTLLTIGKDTVVMDENGNKTAKVSDIHMGTQMVAWYGAETRSMPGQANADKVMILPTADRDLTIISEGDIAIGEGKIEDGVVMVPLRLTAEKLGFTVTWDGEDESVHLTNGTVQTEVQLGEDAYYMATAIKGAVGLTANVSLGAAPYEVDGTTWAPVEVFNLLLDDQTTRLYDNIILL